jgi:hypothetical protein
MEGNEIYTTTTAVQTTTTTTTTTYEQNASRVYAFGDIIFIIFFA